MLFRMLALLLPAGFLAAVVLAARAGAIPAWIALVYGAGSAVTALAYAEDKRRAQRGAWRLSEQTLHWLAMLGGWPGALLAQPLFRHKTQKRAFQLDLWIIVLVHLLAWTWRLTHGPR